VSTSSRALAVLFLCAACDCGAETDDEIRDESSPGNTAFGDRRVELDLLSHVHLADVDRDGRFIDFGTPARMKYTLGDWRTGWTNDGTEGEETFTNAGESGRLFFHVDEAGPLVLRIRMKSVASRNLTPFINGEQVELVRLEEGGFRDYDVPVPAAHVHRGENYLQLRFGATREVDGHDVAASIASLRVVRGETIAEGAYDPPLYESLRADVAIAGATRPSLTTAGGTRVSYYVTVPERGSLGFGVGAQEGSGRAVVSITPEGGSKRELFGEAVSGAWIDRVISLEDLAGQVARIDFETPANARVAWSTPSILVPPPEARPEQAPARNVIVLLVDTLRAEKLRPFNRSSRVDTPHLDRLAEHGAVFENAQAPENWTKPSCASILTGLFPASHGAKTDGARLPERATLLSEHLHANGFRTGSFIANGYVSDRFGFDQGWDHYTNFIRENKTSDAEHVFDEALEWIEENKNHRFFAYVHTIDPHVPYDPPDEFLRRYDARTDYSGQVEPRRTADLLERAKRNPPDVVFDASDERRLRALHDGEISYHDFHMGRFIDRLRELGAFDDTLFIVTSDHGEEFREHGSYGHGHSVYQELLHVPLLAHHARVVPRGRIARTVSTLDIASTVAELVGAPPLGSSEGTSLVSAMHRESPPNRPPVAFSDFLDDRRVIRAGRWKLILRGINATLFDLETDPTEQRELERADHPIAMRYLRIHLGQFLGARDRRAWMDANQTAREALGSEQADIDETTRQQLRELGYAN
jgi:choline-sulfatase